MTTFTTRPEIDGTFGVAASTHWIATAVGMGILERGGNAFDAAVATAFVLQVVEPHLNGPGGDVSMLVHDVRRGKTEVLCGQGPAPAGATIAHYRGAGLDLIPGTGLLAACIPGVFDTYMLLLRDYGTMPLRTVLEPALHYAMHGYPLVPTAASVIRGVAQHFQTHWPSSAAIYLEHGDAPQANALFANPVLARTYDRIINEAEAGGGGREAVIERARDVWSKGFVAEAIDRFCRDAYMDVSGRPNPGVMTGDDLAGWRASVEAPIAYDYGRYTVQKCGPWTQGLVALQQLALLRDYDLASMDPMGVEAIHLQVESAKLAFADRDTFYGDPDFVSVPVETLLSRAYNDERRALVAEQASLELRPGSIAGAGRALNLGLSATSQSAGAGVGEPTVGREHAEFLRTDASRGAVAGDTVHFDIIDRDGNMVSATPSGGWLQSSPAIPSLGFCLGTRAQMFVLDPDHPAGLVPGKRPRSTLSPSMALRDGEPYLAWGTPGGDQQDQWGVQLFIRHVDAGLNLQEAIDAPAWHSEHAPSSFWPRRARPGVLVLEARLPDTTIAGLRERGHIVEVGGPWSEGRLTAAARDGKRRKAAANPRGMQAYAAGR